MHFKNILVVINPENIQQYALARAVRLVDEQNINTPIKITLFSVVYDFLYEMSSLLSSEERQKMHEDVTNQRRQIIQPYADKYKHSNIEYDIQVVWHSNEAEAIAEQSDARLYDLVIKYAKEQFGIASLIFTPTDWQLLRKSKIPVLIVRDGDWKHQRRILVAVNVSGDQDYHDKLNKKLVSFGLDLAENLEKGNIHLVNAYPSPPANLALVPEFSYSEYNNNTIKGQHLINMKELRQHFGIDEDHTHVHNGLPEEVIARVADEIQAELVVLGTIGRKGVSAAFLGNTAEHVISHLNCNLLAIKPDWEE